MPINTSNRVAKMVEEGHLTKSHVRQLAALERFLKKHKKAGNLRWFSLGPSIYEECPYYERYPFCIPYYIAMQIRDDAPPRMTNEALANMIRAIRRAVEIKSSPQPI